jgi:uncharacterized protein YndB with AHSA1/START domain
MPVKVDASGRRSVQAEAEVPGTPEEVWQAIATGPGISSWFVPTEIHANKDGIPEKLICHFGPGTSMDSVSQVTSWDPPHRFTADSRDDMAPGDPTVATEWVIEARSGGTCLVRVVHSWFTSSDKWDNQYEGTEHGWVAFFRILRLYLTHFPGQVGSSLQFMGLYEPAGATSVGSADDSARTLWRGRRAACGDSCRCTAPCRAGRTRRPAGASRVAPSTREAGARHRPLLCDGDGRQCLYARSPVLVRESSTCDRRTRGASVAGVDESAVPRCSHGEPGRARVIVKSQRTLSAGEMVAGFDRLPDDSARCAEPEASLAE